MANKCVSCNNCGHTGWSKNRGNFLITIVLLIFFFVPGVIYEIWRRTGLGVCENCGSDLVAPSNACTSNKPSDAGDLIILGVLGLIGAIVVVFIYSLGDMLINGRASTGKTIRDYENACMKDGIEIYQKSGEYPTMKNGEETSTKVLMDCKGSTNGKYPR